MEEITLKIGMLKKKDENKKYNPTKKSPKVARSPKNIANFIMKYIKASKDILIETVLGKLFKNSNKIPKTRSKKPNNLKIILIFKIFFYFNSTT